MRVDHFAFLVSNMNNSIEFYKEKLGFHFLSVEVDKEHGEKFAFFKLDNASLELLEKLSVKDPSIFEKSDASRRGYCPHVAINCDDLDKIVEFLDERDVKIVGGPFEIKNQVKWLYISDPDGNIIEFVEWLREQ